MPNRKQLWNRYKSVPKFGKHKNLWLTQLFRIYAKADKQYDIHDKLRVPNYRKFLASNGWKNRRVKLFKLRQDYTGLKDCETCCYHGPLTVHHLYYWRLGKEDVKDYRLVCSDCHDILHTKPNQANNDRVMVFNQLFSKNRGKDFKWLHQYLSKH